MPSALASSGLRMLTSRSWKKIWPASGCTTPDTIFTRVDLPAPLSPTRPTISLDWTRKSTSTRALTAPKLLLIPLSSRGISSAIPSLLAQPSLERIQPHRHQDHHASPDPVPVGRDEGHRQGGMDAAQQQNSSQRSHHPPLSPLHP